MNMAQKIQAAGLTLCRAELMIPGFSYAQRTKHRFSEPQGLWPIEGTSLPTYMLYHTEHFSDTGIE